MSIIAIPLPATIAKEISPICCGLPNVEWSPPETFHILLRRIGKIQNQQLWDIEENLENIKMAPFSLTFKKIGITQSKHARGSIWICFEPDSCCENLKRQINAHLRSTNLPAEPAFHENHVILGKYHRPDPEKLMDFLHVNADFSSSSFVVDSFSILSFHSTDKSIYPIEYRKFPLFL